MTQKKTNYNQICVYNSKLDGKEFVGLKYENNNLHIYFPLGYKKATSEKEFKKDILNLFSVLTEFSSNMKSIVQGNNQLNKTEVEFPIHAYLFLITDFLNHGIYKETETFYKRAHNGKICWNKTIKNITPLIIDDDPFYLEFITKNTNHNQNYLITQIHKYCVYESFNKIGFLFSDYMPQKPNIQFNAALFKSIIQLKISQTFNEQQQFLFSNMLQIINFLDNSKDSNNFYYGTEDFEYVWEGIIDKIFGIKNKEKYYPHCFWTINKKTVGYADSDFKKFALRPDTIMITDYKNISNQKIFVLDSKYYKYGVSENFKDLPGSDSIIKQIAYAQFIDKMENEETPKGVFKYKSQKIYNAFILPYNSLQKKIYKYIGKASSDYIRLISEKNKPYYDIHGILIDIKTLMYEHNELDNQRIKELATIIENNESKEYP